MIYYDSRVIGVDCFTYATPIRTMDGAGLCELFWWSVDCPACLHKIGLRSESDGVRDQVFESTNLIPSMGWGSLIPD